MPAERLKLPDVISETSHSDKIPNIGVNQVAKTRKTAVTIVFTCVYFFYHFVRSFV
jgi:hypothetical protein